MDDLADRLYSVIERHGADAVAVYLGGGAGGDASGSIALHRLIKSIGTKSRYSSMTVDAIAKPVVASMVAGNPSLSPQIDPTSKLTLLIGSNPVVSHGHASAFPNPTTRLRSLGQCGKLFVVDPRSTETARLATKHLATRPGSDVALLAYLVSSLLRDGADTAYLERYACGVEELRGSVERFSLELTANLTGLRTVDIEDLLVEIRSAGRLAVATGTGCTMSAYPNVTEWLAWCLGIVTGSLDQPGGMWFNPGFLKRADHRVAVAQRPPGPGPRSRPELRSRWGEYPAVALVDEIEAGNVRALLVMGANPIAALPETDRLVSALETLEVLVVADIATTSVGRIATHVLPVAAPLERSDMTHTYDQLYQGIVAQYTRALVSPVDEAKPLWSWCAELGQRLGLESFADLQAENLTAEDLLATLCESSESFAALQAADGPVADERDVRGWVLERGLPDGHFQVAPRELVDQLADFHLEASPGLVITPRRQRKHFNSMHSPGGDRQELVLSNFDAAERCLIDGDAVRVTSAYGSLETTVRIDEGASRGVASLSHGHESWNVNHLTTGGAGSVDRLTGMPIYSGLPVTVTALNDNEF